jgi:uncharacterized phage-associated protein
MRIEDLLAILSIKHKEKFDTPPNKTKLIKLAYLAEIYFKRNTRNRLTNQEWIYWKFGPYIRDYDSFLSNESIFSRPSSHSEYLPVDIRQDYETEALLLDENTAIHSALTHAQDNLDEILNFVYFDTEPMMAATRRGQTLDFETVLPQAYYAVREFRINAATGEKILRKIRRWEATRRNAT